MKPCFNGKKKKAFEKKKLIRTVKKTYKLESRTLLPSLNIFKGREKPRLFFKSLPSFKSQKCFLDRCKKQSKALNAH